MGSAPTRSSRATALIYCSVWAFGRSGPLKMKPASSRWCSVFRVMMMNGTRRARPHRTSILDYGTGMWTRWARSRARARQRTGRGCVVDASLYETASRGSRATRELSRLREVPSPSHRQQARGAVQGSRQDRHHHRGGGNDRLFAKLAPWSPSGVAKEERFTTNARGGQQVALLAELDAIFLTRTKAMIDLLEAGGVPCAPSTPCRA